MILGGDELEKLICEILLDCWSVTPPLERAEVAQHVVDHVSEAIRKEVYTSLDRMVAKGLILAKPDAAGAPFRYSLPSGAKGKQ